MIAKNTISEIRRRFEVLKPYVAFVKLGTESEAMSFEEMSLIRDIVLCPAICKIGGPDAQNDIFTLFRMGIHSLVGPMIESAFAVEKFLAATAKYDPESSFLELAINLESICGLNNLDKIFAALTSRINRVNVGFSDLAASMRSTVSSPDVIAGGQEIQKRCSSAGKLFTWGGTVTVQNIRMRLEAHRPDYFETRLFVFKTDNVWEKAEWVVEEALRIEGLIEAYTADAYRKRADLSEAREKSIRTRLPEELRLAS